jgi:predicted ester cyclase
VSQERNKELVRRYLDEVWKKGNIDGTESYFTPEYRRHFGPTAPPLDIQGQAARLRGFRTAFPDVDLEIDDDMIAENDRVAFRFTLRGTHEGPFQGIEATGARISAIGVDIVRLEGGLLAEHWGGVDVNSIVQQLRAAPSS